MKKASKATQREPSKRSLEEMPEVDFTKAQVRRNPYAKRIAREGVTVQIGRGRPRKIDEVGGTTPRSIRFPDEVWAMLEERAAARGITLHAALREAILAWARNAA